MNGPDVAKRPGEKILDLAKQNFQKKWPSPTWPSKIFQFADP
jgi:hypothetical protein